MLNESQEKYLASLPDGKMIDIKPFDAHAREIGNAIVDELQKALPYAFIQLSGSLAFGIGGQNDIDVLIFPTPEEFDSTRIVIEKMFGTPSRVTKSVKWEFKREGFDVEIFMTDKDSYAGKEQAKIFEIVSQIKELRDEYEQTKLPYGPIDSKEYLRKMFEFFNKILK